MMDDKVKPAQKKKITQQEPLENNIDKLLGILNHPETNCLFWKVDEPYAHIMGICPVNRTTVEIINENGFNPYEKKTEERLFKSFKVFILDCKNDVNNNEEDMWIRKEIEKNGIIYIKNHDIFYIINTIRSST